MGARGQEMPATKRLVTAETGFTVLEVVMVMGLMAVILAVAVTGIKQMGKSSDIGAFSNELNQIVYGMNEYKMINQKIPAGSSWPPSLNDFVESSLRGRYSYKCDSSTSNKVTLTTTYVFGADPTQKLKDQNLCTNDANTTYNADKTVTCRAVVYANESCS
jgi:type II secretory pathway pseudopilin PulG